MKKYGPTEAQVQAAIVPLDMAPSPSGDNLPDIGGRNSIFGGEIARIIIKGFAYGQNVILCEFRVIRQFPSEDRRRTGAPLKGAINHVIPLRSNKQMKLRNPSEDEIQVLIVDALRVAGFHVYVTSTHFSKGNGGPTGQSPGIPDLLVSHPAHPFVFAGVEVKRDSKAPWRADQRQASDARRYVVCWDPAEAVKHCCSVLLWQTHEIENRMAHIQKAQAVVKALEDGK